MEFYWFTTAPTTGLYIEPDGHCSTRRTPRNYWHAPTNPFLCHSNPGKRLARCPTSYLLKAWCENESAGSFTTAELTSTLGWPHPWMSMSRGGSYRAGKVLSALFQFCQNLFGDRLQGLKYADTLERDGFDYGFVLLQ